MRMETGTFPQEDVRDHLEKYFVPVKFESGKDSEQFMRFQVKGTPTYVFLDSGGDEVYRATGYCTPDAFIAELETARAKAKPATD